MVSTIVYQLTRGLTTEQIKKAGFDTYFVDHTTGVYPQAASGEAFSANTFAVTGDVLADLHEDLSAEQKARLTYDNILRYADDPDVRDPIKFLRAREIVHYQRFGEGLRIATDNLNSRKTSMPLTPRSIRNKCGHIVEGCVCSIRAAPSKDAGRLFPRWAETLRGFLLNLLHSSPHIKQSIKQEDHRRLHAIKGKIFKTRLQHS